MNLDQFLTSQGFRGAIKIIVALLALALVFTLGIFIGTEKARFSYSWGEHYFRAITGPNPNNFFPDRLYLNAHGTIGTILDVNGNILVVKNPSGVEKNVSIGNQTIIRRGPQALYLSDLRTGETIAAIGQPDTQGQINAALIRVLDGFPPPPGISTLPAQ